VPALGAAGSTEAFEALLAALAGASPALREHIAEALSSVGKQHLLQNLAQLSQSADGDVRLGIAWTLGKIGDPSCVSVLERFLRDGDARLRASAAGALGKVPNAVAIKALVAASGDPDPKTRAAVVNALGKCAAADSGELRAVLSERLRDPDGFVRNRAGIWNRAGPHLGRGHRGPGDRRRNGDPLGSTCALDHARLGRHAAQRQARARDARGSSEAAGDPALRRA
jgi:HEAT repeat protein